MCTVSWRYTRDGYGVFFNRDEQRTRPRAEPPRLETLDTVPVALPRDPQAGGTWIAANACGVTVALLNFYDALTPPPLEHATSRGLLVRALSASASRAHVGQQLASMTLEHYRPFHLLAFDDGGVTRATWDGFALSAGDRFDTPLLTTSSFETEEVLRSRSAIFERLVAAQNTDDAHRAFHRSHEPERSAFSPCMHRSDACTVSFTHVSATRDAIRMDYLDAAPCHADAHAMQRTDIARPAPA